MLVRLIEAMLILLLLLIVASSILSLMALLKGVRIMAYGVNSTYLVSICLNNTTPITVGIYGPGAFVEVPPGLYKCLNYTSPTLPRNITLGLMFMNVTLSVAYG